MGRTCRYSNGLSRTGRKFAAPFRGFRDIPWAVWDTPFSKNIFEDILSLTAVASGFFADSANTYQDLPFEPLKLHLCANALIGRKWKKQPLNLRTVARKLEKISPPCVQCIARGPLKTHQLPAQSVQPFPRFGKGVSTFARARVPHN